MCGNRNGNTLKKPASHSLKKLAHAQGSLDRLLDDAHVIVIEGDSYRNPPPAKRPAKRRARRTKENAA